MRGWSRWIAPCGRLATIGSLLGLLSIATPVPAALGADRSVASTPAVPGSCPWASASFDAGYTPGELAKMVIARMTLPEKLGMVNLHRWRGYENATNPIPSLCIPALTLQDGPNGIAFNDTGVTQLPASLALSATFDTGLAQAYGTVEGNEARRQGIDVVQGPNLNILRVPQSGRAFEGYGEDPFLVSAMGVADITGIQRAGVLANAKHFTAYSQETDRITLNQDVAWRTLEEMYLPPFQAAVTQGHVASIMCSYGTINHVSDCAMPRLYRLLYTAWGFKGFVRSDLASVSDARSAFAAGMSAIKPPALAQLTQSLAAGTLPVSKINDSVLRMLTTMFTYGLISKPIVGKLDTKVSSVAHAKVALDVAKRSIVLLKDRGGVLPLSKHTSSIAVIGTDASNGAMVAGFGSAHVRSPSRSNPIDAIRAAVGPGTTVTYAPGGSATSPAPPISRSKFTLLPQAKLPALAAHRLNPSALRSIVGTGSFEGVAGLLRRATATIEVPSSGSYVFSLTSNGNAWLSVAGHQLISSPGLHARSSWSSSTTLLGERKVTISLSWYPRKRGGMPLVGVRAAQTPIEKAVDVARHAKVAVIFANDVAMEGTDRASLSLPSDENALINAVASVNHHTVVVLNTGGAVTMPWIAKVAGVVEAWYPGQEDGKAIASVLFGAVDPSGRLPITFPVRNDQTATGTRAAFPGDAGSVSYDEGLNVGYRYDQANKIKPLFPFGFGLSYTTFSMSGLTVTSSSSGVVASVVVTNTGKTAGSTVAQAYLQFPAAAGEPPLQLKAFAPVTLAPGQSRTVALTLPTSAFEAYLTGGWQTLSGNYTLFVGSSSADLPLRTTLAAPDAIAPGNGTR
jgi:beta-glucosidase